MNARRRLAPVLAALFTLLLLAPAAHAAPPAPSDPGTLVAATSTDLPTGSTGTFAATGGGIQPAFSFGNWTCVIFAGDPYRGAENGRQVVEGIGHMLCAGSGYQEIRIVITVQQYRGFNIWANKNRSDTGYSVASALYNFAYWVCAAGTGNQQYRIITDGYVHTGTFHAAVQSLHYLRATCP